MIALFLIAFLALVASLAAVVYPYHAKIFPSRKRAAIFAGVSFLAMMVFALIGGMSDPKIQKQIAEDREKAKVSEAQRARAEVADNAAKVAAAAQSLRTDYLGREPINRIPKAALI